MESLTKNHRLMLNLRNLILFICFAFAGSGMATDYAKNLQTDFGAKGDGITNDSAAFRAAAAWVQGINTVPGDTIKLTIPAGTTPYIVGEQYHVANQYPYYQNNDIFKITNLTAPLTITGGPLANGAPTTFIKIASGLHYGSFDKDTGALYNPPPGLFIDWNYAASVGNVFSIGTGVNVIGSVTIENLDIDGSNENLILGGTWGDAGRQLDASGIKLSNCSNAVVQNIHTHHNGLDGILIVYLNLTETNAPTPHTLTNVISEYNARQGLSWVGGVGSSSVNGLTAMNCKFNHTGRSSFMSLPGAGVDIEADSICRYGYFYNCEFIDNVGPGMVSANGNNAHVTFDTCTFWGATASSLIVTMPYFTFTGCKIYGTAFYGYSAADSSRTVFNNCSFEDKKYPDSNGIVYGDYLIQPFNFNGAGNGTEFVNNCSFVANTHRAVYVDGADTILKDCTILHKYSGLANQSYQSLLKNCYLENVHFTEAFTPTPPSGSAWYIWISNPIVADGVTVGGPSTYYCKWEDWSWGATGTIPFNASGYWNFDEGTGTMACDSSSIYDGTICGGATWVDGKIGNALNFNGTDGYVAVDNCVYNKPGQISGITVMAWIKTTGTNGAIADWDSSEYWSLGINGSGKISWKTFGQTQGLHDFVSVNTVNDGAWHHVAVTYDSATGWKYIYIDGALDRSVFAYSAVQALGTGVTRYGFIGVGSEAITFNGTKNNLFFNGTIDEVRVLRRVCDSNDIHTQYQQAQAVGCWYFDEGSGSTAMDSSGKGNNGMLTNMDITSCWVDGEAGKALQFDGSNDYVDCGTNSSLSFADKKEWSFETWLYITNSVYWQAFTGSGLATNSKYLMIHYNTNMFFTSANGNYYAADIGFAQNTWQHLVVTVDLNGRMRFYLNGIYKATVTPDTTAMDFYNIGRGGGGRYFGGKIDGVKIYSKALTATEVDRHYSERADWRFDEGIGTTAYDSAGINNGMLVNMDNSCWVNGKVGTALQFNGTNQYVDCGTNGSLSFADRKAWSFEAWLYITNSVYWQAFTGSGLATNNKYLMIHYNTNMFFTSANGNYYAADIGFAQNTWQRIAVTVDTSGNMRFYLNGIYKATVTPDTTAMDFYKIGRGAGGRYFGGIIDEVRIYDRTLSDVEIQGDYSSGGQ